jgi:hypothetical protein
MSAVVDEMSAVVVTNDTAFVSLAVTTVSMLILLVEALAPSAIFNDGIEVPVSADIKLDCSTDVSTSVAGDRSMGSLQYS